MNQPRTQLDIDRELLESINVDHGLTELEVGFVDSCLQQLKSGNRELSARQRQTAERIQEKLDAGERR